MADYIYLAVCLRDLKWSYSVRGSGRQICDALHRGHGLLGQMSPELTYPNWPYSLIGLGKNSRVEKMVFLYHLIAVPLAVFFAIIPKFFSMFFLRTRTVFYITTV